MEEAIYLAPYCLECVPMALKEWRCCNCNRILAKMDLSPSSTIQIKCRCGILNTVRTNAKYAMAHMPIINV